MGYLFAVQSHYYVIQVKDAPVDRAEEISEKAFENGAQGIEENIPFEQSGEFYEATLLESDFTDLKIFFYSPPSEEFVFWLCDIVPEENIHLSQEVNKDWMEEWKKGFEAFELINGIYVVPSWTETPKEAKHGIQIDPGMAFGTGTHETTKLAAKLMSGLDLQGKNVLDVGTGTGILAFLAEKMGANNIMGIEIEDEARRTAKENVEHNKSEVQIIDGLIHDFVGSFDLVIANIIDGVLVKLQEELNKKTKSSGHLLLTGILDERDDNFRERFSFENYELIERATMKEWVGYLLKKK